MKTKEEIRVTAKVLGMGDEVEHAPLDPADGRVYVLLEMGVEDARNLAPVLLETAVFKVLKACGGSGGMPVS